MRLVKLSKFGSYAQTLSESAGLFTYVGVVLVVISASTRIYHLVEYLLICHAYGDKAWASGLRVVNKWGELSDGGNLTALGTVTLLVTPFILMIPIFLGSFWLFSYVGLRFRGRRLDDPRPKTPKKKWKTIGKSDHAA